MKVTEILKDQDLIERKITKLLSNFERKYGEVAVQSIEIIRNNRNKINAVKLYKRSRR